MVLTHPFLDADAVHPALGRVPRHQDLGRHADNLVSTALPDTAVQCGLVSP